MHLCDTKADNAPETLLGDFACKVHFKTNYSSKLYQNPLHWLGHVRKVATVSAKR